MATTSSVPWEPNSASSVCRLCGWKWGLLRHRRHHCRNCGKLVCGRCSRNNIKLPEYNDEAVRVCDKCFLVITAPASARKKIPELAVTSKVQFAVQPGTVKPIKDKNDIDIVDFDEADESEEDNDDEEGASKDPGHLLQLEEMGLHNSTSHDFGGPNTAESAHTQNSHVTTSTDYDETIVISVQEGVTSNRSSADAKGLKLTLSRFGNMNFSDDESSGPNSIVNSSNPNESKQFDFSPTTQKAATEKSVERSLYIEEEEVKEENATMSTAEGTSNSTEAAATVGADTSTSAVAAVAVGSTETAAEITNASVDKPLPKPLDITPKNRSKNRLVVRRSSLLATAGTPAEAAEATPATTSSSSAGTVAVTAAPQLAAHLTPMPAGSTVRRLSTLTSRTPFNSTTTPSPSAASAAADAATVDAAAVGSVGGATGDARTTANTTSSSKEKAETNTINHTTEHLNAPSVDSGAATPVLSMKPLFFRSSLSPESTCDSPSAELGENTAGAIVSEVHETVSPLVAAVLTAPSSGSVLPVEELLSGVATQLTEADSVTDAAAQGTAAANVTADIAADANNAESVTDEVDGGGGGAADRTESTATTENLGESAQDNAASGPGTKGNNKKGGKKNRNRK